MTTALERASPRAVSWQIEGLGRFQNLSVALLNSMGHRNDTTSTDFMCSTNARSACNERTQSSTNAFKYSFYWPGRRPSHPHVRITSHGHAISRFYAT